MFNLTLQVYGAGTWQDAMTLSFAGRAACDALAGIVDPHDAFERLRLAAAQLRALPDLLRDSGLPHATFNHPAIALKNLDQRLLAWGLQ